MGRSFCFFGSGVLFSVVLSYILPFTSIYAQPRRRRPVLCRLIGSGLFPYRLSDLFFHPIARFRRELEEEEEDEEEDRAREGERNGGHGW